MKTKRLLALMLAGVLMIQSGAALAAEIDISDSGDVTEEIVVDDGEDTKEVFASTVDTEENSDEEDREDFAEEISIDDVEMLSDTAVKPDIWYEQKHKCDEEDANTVERAAGNTDDESYVSDSVTAQTVDSINMSMSQDGINLLKSLEGCVLKAYKPVASEPYYTIGYGHYGADVYAGMTITQAQAEALLKQDVVKYANAVNNFANKYGISLNQKQFDALTSFTYNCGSAAWDVYTFPLKTYLINGISKYSSSQITDAFTSSIVRDSTGNVNQGLVNRRKKEAEYFLSGGSTLASLSSTSFPTTIVKGQNFVPKGIITASDKITWVWVGVQYGNGYSHALETEANPFTTSYDISKISSNLKFSNLAAGDYTFQIDVIVGGTYKTLCRQSFKVISQSLSAPQNVKLNMTTIPKGGTVMISWNKSSNATSYIIDGWSNNKEIMWKNVGNVTSYTFSGLSEGTYSFFVIAKNGDVASPSSVGVTLKVANIVMPAPQNVKLNMTTIPKGGTATISWNRSSYATSYIIDGWSNNKEIMWKSVGNVTSYTLSGLSEGTYHFFVIAQNGDAASPSSVGVTLRVCNHTYQTTTTKAKPGVNGKTVTKCSICGSVKSTTTIYAPKTMSLSSTAYTFDYAAKTPSVTVKDSAGQTISPSNYTVSYASGRKYVGSYKVTVTFKGSKYTGSMSKTFVINPKATTLSSVTAASKGFTARWSKVTTQTSGYQLQYSTSSKFTSAKTVTITSNKTTSKKITKLTARKKYYVRVRTYKTVSGKKYYSSWSSAKAVTTKK